MAGQPQDLDQLLNSGFRYALSLCHDPVDAEDLLHDACAKVLAAGKVISKGYLFTTIRNGFIDRYRRSRILSFTSIDASADEWNIEPASPDRWQMPDIIASDHLHEALGELRPDERETIFLAVVEGYTAQEIADMTQRPRGTVLSLLHRTRQKLRRLLAERDMDDNVGQA